MALFRIINIGDENTPDDKKPDDKKEDTGKVIKLETGLSNYYTEILNKYLKQNNKKMIQLKSSTEDYIPCIDCQIVESYEDLSLDPDSLMEEKIALIPIARIEDPLNQEIGLLYQKLQEEGYQTCYSVEALANYFKN